MRTKLSCFFLSIFLLGSSQGLWAEEPRDSNLKLLEKQGFKAASSLPQREVSQGKLRPQQEIEARLTALRLLVLWVAAPRNMDTQAFRSEALESYGNWLTPEEKAIFELSQAEANKRYLDSIGWKMENM